MYYELQFIGQRPLNGESFDVPKGMRNNYYGEKFVCIS